MPTTAPFYTCILFSLDLVFVMSVLFENLARATFVVRVDHNNFAPIYMYLLYMLWFDFLLHG